MHKILFSIFFIGVSLFSKNIDDNSKLQNIIEKITNINEQIAIVESNSNDTNVSTNGTKYTNVKKTRQELIAKIPPLIYKQDFKLDTQLMQKKITSLHKKIELKDKNSKKDTFLLQSLQAKMIFYQVIERINAYSLHNSFEENFSSILQEAQLNLKTITLSHIQNGIDAKELVDERMYIRATIDAYLQILQYLDENINLLKSNYLFEKLDIDNIITFINEILPFKSNYINGGKLLICIFILSIFELVRFFLKRRRFFIFISNLKKAKYSSEERKSIIKSTNAPFLTLLLVFAIKLCVSVLYYPYATAEHILMTFNIVYIIVFAWLIIGIINGYGIVLLNDMAQQDDPSFRKEVANLILKILYFVIIIIALLMILSILGVNVSAIVASLGIGGLAVAWASKDVLANLFASILLLVDNSFSQGDWIVCGKIEGHVVEIGLRRTTIRGFDNSLLFVPNSILANDPIKNWSKRKVGRRIKMSIGVTYGASKKSLQQCVNDIKEMLLNHPNIAKPSDTSLSPKDYRLSFKEHIVSIYDLKGYKRTLLVYLDDFQESSINILVYCFSQSTQWDTWLEVKEDVMYKIMDIVEKNGLSFAFPSQSIYMENLTKEQKKNLLMGEEKR